MVPTRAYGVWTINKLYTHLKKIKILWEEGPDWHLETDERTALLYIIMQRPAEWA